MKEQLWIDGHTQSLVAVTTVVSVPLKDLHACSSWVQGQSLRKWSINTWRVEKQEIYLHKEGYAYVDTVWISLSSDLAW